MAHESFEDDTIAKLLNDNFICIKVDREKRPDILNYAKYTKYHRDINGKPAIYICSNYSCQSPIKDVNKAINSLKEKIIN